MSLFRQLKTLSDGSSINGFGVKDGATGQAPPRWKSYLANLPREKGAFPAGPGAGDGAGSGAEYDWMKGLFSGAGGGGGHALIPPSYRDPRTFFTDNTASTRARLDKVLADNRASHFGINSVRAPDGSQASGGGEQATGGLAGLLEAISARAGRAPGSAAGGEILAGLTAQSGKDQGAIRNAAYIQSETLRRQREEALARLQAMLEGSRMGAQGAFGSASLGSLMIPLQNALAFTRLLEPKFAGREDISEERFSF